MKQWLIGATALGVVLTACGAEQEADLGVSETLSQAAEGVRLPSLSLRSGDAGEANSALTALFLAESGVGRVAFEDSSIEGANATFSGVTLNLPGDGVADGVMRADRLELVGLDMTDAGANFSQMTFSGVTLATSDQAATVNLGSIQLTNPSAEVTAFVASLLGKGVPQPPPSGEALRFDGLSLNELAVDAGAAGQVALEEVSLLSVGDLKVGRTTLAGLAVNLTEPGEPAMDIQLGNLTLDGADLAFLPAILGAEGEDAATEAFISSVYANPLDPKLDAINLSDMVFDMDGISLQIPSLTAFVERNSEGALTKSVTEPFKLMLDVDGEQSAAAAEAAEPLSLLGYERLELEMASVANYDPANDSVELKVEDNYYALADGMKINFGADMSGLTAYGEAIGAAAVAEFGQPQPGAALEAISNLSFNRFELNIQDDSMLDRGINLAATLQGEDPVALRGQMQFALLALPALAGQAGVDGAIATELATALSTFLQEPGNLNIKFTPDVPIAAADFANVQELTKDRLGFSATASQ